MDKQKIRGLTKFEFDIVAYMNEEGYQAEIRTKEKGKTKVSEYDSRMLMNPQDIYFVGEDSDIDFESAKEIYVDFLKVKLSKDKCRICDSPMSEPIFFMGNETQFCLGKCHQKNGESQ